MFYQFLLLTGFCVAVQVLSAQNNTKSNTEPHRIIDSLKQVLLTAKEDTNKVKTLNLLSKLTMQTSEYDQSIKYGEDALALAGSVHVGDEQGWDQGRANAYTNIGVAYFRQGNYSESMKNQLASLKISQKIGYKKGIGNSYNNIGIINLRQGNYAEALKNYVASVKIKEEMGDKLGFGATYNNIGSIYKIWGNYPEAMKYYLLSLKIREEIGDKIGISSCYGDIGILYRVQGNYQEALKNQLAALSIQEELGDRQGIASSYFRIGVIYDDQGNYSGALENYKASLKIREEIGDQQGIGVCYINIASTFSAIGNYSEALKNFMSALKVTEEIGDKEAIGASYMGIGQAYSKQKKFTQALQYMNKGLTILKEIEAKENIAEGYLAMAETYAAMNDYKNAYNYQELYSGLQDTLFNEESSRQTAQIKEQYESEKKDAQILVLNKDNELQVQQANYQRTIKNIFIAGFALLLLIAFLFINRLRLKQRLKLQQIRNGIASDLHDDVGSVLSSIAIFSELATEEVKDKSPKAVTLLQNINENARTTIDAMSDTVWAINPKNDRFENIMVRMRTFAAGILEAKNIDLSFPPSPALSDLKLSMEKRKNLYLIFKEAVNNVAKYSISKNCSIQLGLEGKKLSMEITDDGIGFDMNDHPAGNGQVNMQKRSDELNGALDIKSSAGNGTRIHLSFTT